MNYQLQNSLLKADSESAWFYKTNVLLELSKFAEMSGDVQQKAELQRQYKDALKENDQVGHGPRTDGKIKTLR